MSSSTNLTLDHVRGILKGIPNITLIDDMQHVVEYRDGPLFVENFQLKKNQFTAEYLSSLFQNSTIALYQLVDPCNGGVTIDPVTFEPRLAAESDLPFTLRLAKVRQ